MTYSVAKDYLDYNIRCNSSRVAYIPFVDGYLKDTGKKKRKCSKNSQTQPLGRMGTPTVIASLALYLSSDGIFSLLEPLSIDGELPLKLEMETDSLEI
jgi:NAD(P)-dependent dehydrogenase (short-subunit alcohol dehydrogenase family)